MVFTAGVIRHRGAEIPLDRKLSHRETHPVEYIIQRGTGINEMLKMHTRDIYWIKRRGVGLI